jgi:hypothetical protein
MHVRVPPPGYELQGMRGVADPELPVAEIASPRNANRRSVRTDQMSSTALAYRGMRSR